jgi:hypothetical protein
MELSQIREEYDDWVKLLKQTKHEEMLDDSYDVWLEAMTVATILIKQNLVKHITEQLEVPLSEEYDDDAQMTVTDIKQLQASWLKKLLTIVESQ